MPDMIIEHAVCTECDGTGLYVGFAESEGTAVICKRCKGSGEVKRMFRYEEFTKRRMRSDVKRVYATNLGFTLNAERDTYGMPYADWHNGQSFPVASEDRQRTCPAWWYRSADCSRKPEWPECGNGAFPGCQHFGSKAACWVRWDKEFGQVPAPAAS